MGKIIVTEEYDEMIEKAFKEGMECGLRHLKGQEETMHLDKGFQEIIEKLREKYK